MDTTKIGITQVDILKSVGHKSRTLLNGITGPLQIIRSLSDDPKLIEPLRILELSVSRFERFSLRSTILSDMLGNNFSITTEPIDINNLIRYIILDLTDLLDFYNVKIKLENESSATVSTDNDLLSQCFTILFEQLISILDAQSQISVKFEEGKNQQICKISCNDSGLVYNSLKATLYSSEHSIDTDIFLLKKITEKLQIEVSLEKTEDNKTIIKLKFN
ncbi:MAG TPA: hypothetical protein PLA24_08545 [Tenuifilaceae bacterium]|nr:hypothetical protein [Tenuifilaceae bacterium]